MSDTTTTAHLASCLSNTTLDAEMDAAHRRPVHEDALLAVMPDAVHGLKIWAQTVKKTACANWDNVLGALRKAQERGAARVRVER